MKQKMNSQSNFQNSYILLSTNFCFSHVAKTIAANLPLRILHAPLLFFISLNVLPQCYTTLSPQLVCVVQSEKHIKYYLLQVLEFYP